MLAQNSLWIAVAFIVAILISRITVRIVWTNGWHKKAEPKSAGIKIHHLTYGLALLIISGYIAVVSDSDSVLIPIAFGAGLGIFIDEFYAMLRILSKYWFVEESGGETYHAKQTYVVMAVATAILFLIPLIAYLT